MLGITLLKGQEIIRVDKDMEKGGILLHSCKIVGAKCQVMQLLRKTTVWRFLKIQLSDDPEILYSTEIPQNTTIRWSRNPVLGFITKGNINRSLKTCLHSNVHCRIVGNSQVYINGRLDKEDVRLYREEQRQVYNCIEIVYSYIIYVCMYYVLSSICVTVNLLFHTLYICFISI